MRSTRQIRWSVAVLLAVSLGVGSFGVPAFADPDGEDNASLTKELDAAARGYLEATTKLEISQRRQKEITAQVAVIETDLARHSAAVGQLAAAAYRNGPMAGVTALMVSDSPDILVDRLTILGGMAAHEDAQINQLVTTRAQLAQMTAAVESEIAEQRKLQAEMDKRRRAAEKALAQVGGTQTTGYSGSGSASAAPAPRNADGSWPTESCSVNDPTTTGCITPRTLHAMQQAQAAGFKHYVSCYRSGGSGEHPKGRACDFAAATSGFGGTATGAERTYGNNLAAYFVRNASRLGVLYVIWYRQIWMASTGWRAYSGSGSPAADHTNHVHLSVY